MGLPKRRGTIAVRTVQRTSGATPRSTFSVETFRLAPQGIAEKVQAAGSSTRRSLLNAERTPSSRRWGPRERELVLARGRRLPGWGRSSGWVRAVILGRPASLELFAGAAEVALTWSASAMRIVGTVWASPRPASAPWPRGVSRIAVRSSSAAGLPKLPALFVGGQHPLESAAAPALPGGSVRPAGQASSQRRPRAASKLETSGLGHASRPKPWALGCLPQELS